MTWTLRVGGCTDLPWASSNGWTCGEYGYSEEKGTKCADGGYGPDWDAEWGAFADWANDDGVHAGQACCECGGPRQRPFCRSQSQTWAPGARQNRRG